MDNGIPILDEVDIEIIRSLQNNARAKFSDIARKCGVSNDTISKRFRRMKEMGIIKGLTILLSPKVFGYNYIASIYVQVNYPRVEEAIEYMKSIPEVIFCTATIGSYHIFGIAMLKDVSRLAFLKDLIKGHPLVRDVETSIWVDEILLCPQNFELKSSKRR